MTGNITDFMENPAAVEKGGKMHDQLVEMEALLSETAHQENAILSPPHHSNEGVSASTFRPSRFLVASWLRNPLPASPLYGVEMFESQAGN